MGLVGWITDKPVFSPPSSSPHSHTLITTPGPNSRAWRRVGRLLGGDTTLGLSVAVAKELGLGPQEVGGGADNAILHLDGPTLYSQAVDELGVTTATL